MARMPEKFDPENHPFVPNNNPTTELWGLNETLDLAARPESAPARKVKDGSCSKAVSTATYSSTNSGLMSTCGTATPSTSRLLVKRLYRDIPPLRFIARAIQLRATDYLEDMQDEIFKSRTVLVDEADYLDVMLNRKFGGMTESSAVATTLIDSNIMSLNDLQRIFENNLTAAEQSYAALCDLLPQWGQEAARVGSPDVEFSSKLQKIESELEQKRRNQTNYKHFERLPGDDEYVKLSVEHLESDTKRVRKITRVLINSCELMKADIDFEKQMKDLTAAAHVRNA